VQGLNIRVGLTQLAFSHEAGAADANLVVGAHKLAQVDQMVAKRSRPVPQGRPEERGRWDQQVELFDEVWCRLQKVVSFIEGIFEQVIALNGITLEEAHLLEVSDATVCHFSALARGSRGKIVRVNDGAVETAARGIEHNTSAVSTTAYD